MVVVAGTGQAMGMMCDRTVTPEVGAGHAHTYRHCPIQRHKMLLTVPIHFICSCFPERELGWRWVVVRRREGHQCLTLVSGGPPVIYIEHHMLEVPDA
jgi:hypothetical protein